MRSNISGYQLKIDCYRYKILNVILTITTKPKPILNTQERKRKIHIPMNKVVKTQRKRARSKGNLKTVQKKINCNKHMPNHTHFKPEWTKFSNQKIDSD